VNPTFGLAPQEKRVMRKQASVDWSKDPIIFFSNSKPNFKELTDGLRLKLAQLRQGGEIDFIAKPAAGVPATAEMIESVASKYRIAILGSAD
jgi:hypothetical protein